MHRSIFFEEMLLRYNKTPDYPWDNSNACVFRHTNRKWFCLFMVINPIRLGIDVKGELEIINIKSHPSVIGSLRLSKGVFPAYHMNKEHWITLVLNEVNEDLLWSSLSESYLLTKSSTQRFI